MDPVKVAQMVEVLNGLTARDALCLLVGCTLTVLDEATPGGKDLWCESNRLTESLRDHDETP
jgi:hypothetical protein